MPKHGCRYGRVCLYGQDQCYLLICFRFRFGTAAIFFHCDRLESVFVLVTKEKVGRHPMPPTSDGAMDIRATREAVIVGREQGNQNWCPRRALHVKIGGLVTGSQAS